MSVESPGWLGTLQELAFESGFVRFAVAPVVDATGFNGLVEWIESGYAAGMDYFENRKDAYRNPTGVMPGAKSIIVLAYPYPAEDSGDRPLGSGRVARYAWSGVDYHDTIHGKLKQLRRFIQSEVPEAKHRGCVDTAPLLEREVAQLAGVGWRGKNTLVLNRLLGSYFFLSCILIDVELPCDAAHDKSYCGTCTACLDACPTDAFVGPGTLDAGRCISYLTIEHRGPIAEPLREGVGDWLFGCDICQEVCPWNRKPARTRQVPSEERSMQWMDLEDWFAIDEETFRSRFRKTPFWRTRLNGMRRNAAIVMGNVGDPTALPVLQKGAELDDPVVRDACLWAIARITERKC